VAIESSENFLCNRVPINAARLSVPLHHQPVECRHENAGLCLYFDICTKLTRCDADRQQPTQGRDTLLTYPFHLIRLGAYWNRMEPEPGIFYPDELDWQIDAAERARKHIILCVGPLKTFHYPEFFVPAHYLIPIRILKFYIDKMREAG